MPNELSVIIITKNEEEWIENCLRSVMPLSPEIVVVDSVSDDKTVSICKKYGAKIYSKEWGGFSEQKNYALSKATKEWVLFIDADERVSRELSDEIKQIINSRTSVSQSYTIPRRNVMLGKPVHYGGWWPDYVIRLSKKGQINGWDGELHESLVVRGEVAKTKAPIFHLTHRGISWMLRKSISYTAIEAKLKFKKNHPPVVWWRFFRVMATEFWYRLVATSGWKDGIVGWIEAISQSYNQFLIYVNLWELQQGQSMEQEYRLIDKDLADNDFRQATPIS